MRFIILAAPLVMTACAGGLSGALTPEQAVIRAAAAPIAGTFVMTVRGTGRQDFLLYLNSQADYRDQRNLSVEVPRGVELALADRFGVGSLPEFLRGRKMRISGEARRVRIDFTHDGHPTGKYYYQTHITLTSADQASLIG